MVTDISSVSVYVSMKQPIKVVHIENIPFFKNNLQINETRIPIFTHAHE